MPYEELLFVGTNYHGFIVTNASADSILFQKFVGETITEIYQQNGKIFVTLKSDGIAFFKYQNFVIEQIVLNKIPITSLKATSFWIIASSNNGKSLYTYQFWR